MSGGENTDSGGSGDSVGLMYRSASIAPFLKLTFRSRKSNGNENY